MFRSAWLLLVGLFPVSTFAAVQSIGQISENLFGPVAMVTEIMIGVSYLAGAAMLVFGLLQYKAYRQNPKMVSITMPIVLVISGLILLALPKVTTIEGWSWAATVQSKPENVTSGEFMRAQKRNKPAASVPSAPASSPTQPQPMPQQQPNGTPVPPETETAPPVAPPAVYVDPDEPPIP